MQKVKDLKKIKTTLMESLEKGDLNLKITKLYKIDINFNILFTVSLPLQKCKYFLWTFI